MIVVADSSPLVALTNIEQLSILPRLFGTVTVPPQVILELASAKRPLSVRALAEAPPEWVLVRLPILNPAIEHLHAGETAAINLATELRADLILIDEQRGRQAATERHLRPIGTVGLLERAALQGWLDLREAFGKLRTTDFWVSESLLDERLQAFELQIAQLRQGLRP